MNDFKKHSRFENLLSPLMSIMNLSIVNTTYFAPFSFVNETFLMKMRQRLNERRKVTGQQCETPLTLQRIAVHVDHCENLIGYFKHLF